MSMQSLMFPDESIHFEEGRFRCQRWTHGRPSYRDGAEDIDSRKFGVAPIDGDAEARDFCIKHHYSGSYPAARFRAGLYRARAFFAPELVGVAVFSVPPQKASIPKWLGVPANEGVELGRFVLMDDVEGNGETWFLSRALKLLRDAKPSIRRVLSYSDPVERRSISGDIVKPGHFGTIYQASNARHLGMSGRIRQYLDSDGRSFSPRALSKIRGGEVGAVSAERRLVEAGAPPRTDGESSADYLARALVEGGFSSEVHPGKVVYGFGLTKADRKAMAANPQDYPKKPLTTHADP